MLPQAHWGDISTGSLYFPHHSSHLGHSRGASLGPCAALPPKIPMPAPVPVLAGHPGHAAAGSHPYHLQAGPGQLLKRLVLEGSCQLFTHLFILIKLWEALALILTWDGSIFALWDGNGRYPVQDLPPKSPLQPCCHFIITTFSCYAWINIRNNYNTY